MPVGKHVCISNFGNVGLDGDFVTLSYARFVLKQLLRSWSVEPVYERCDAP